MIILLLGFSGFFGQAFNSEAKRRGWGIQSAPYSGASFRVLKSMMESRKYDCCINAAAHVCKPSVELNENQKGETIMGNIAFSQAACLACEATETKFCQLSSGCLFCDLTGTKKFTEKDEPHLTIDKGAGVYVSSKELSERIVRRYEKHWICRVRLPLDHIDGERNFISKFLSFPRIVNLRNSMSHRFDAVNACLDMIEQRVPFGTYHVTNPGAITPGEIITAYDRANTQGREINLWPIEDYAKSRRTPLSAGELDVSKLLATGVKIRPIQEAVVDAIKNWRKA